MFTDESVTKLAAALAISLGGLTPVLAICYIVGKACEWTGKNPDAEHPIRTTMALGAGLAEALVIYIFVICLILCLVI